MATTTSTSKLPGYIEKPLKGALGDIEKWLSSSDNYVYGSKPGETLFTGMSGMQDKALGNIDWLADQDFGAMFGTDTATDMWKNFASMGPMMMGGNYSAGQVDMPDFGFNMGNAGQTGAIDAPGFDFTVNNGGGAQTVQGQGAVDTSAITGGGVAGQIDLGQYGAPDSVNTERLVDEGGFLGSIDSYMNPYLDQVLDPTIREINEQSQRQQNQIGAQAMMSGAFGDARHGIAEGEQRSRTNEAISDTVGSTYRDAFDTAMGLRAGDIGRFDTSQRFNAGMEDAAKNRQMQGDQFNVEQKRDSLMRDLEAAISRTGFADKGADRLQAAEELTARFGEDAAQRILQASTQQGQFDQAGAEMDFQAALENAGFEARDLDRLLESRTRQGQFDQAGAEMDLQAALANLDARNADADRGLTRDANNQRARQIAQENYGTAADKIAGLGGTKLDQFFDINDALYNAGELQQEQQQLQDDARRRFAEEKSMKKYNDAVKLLMALQGSPMTKTEVSKEESDNGMWNTIGAIVGGLF